MILAIRSGGTNGQVRRLVLLHFTTFLKDSRKPFAGKETVCDGQCSQWKWRKRKRRSLRGHGNAGFASFYNVFEGFRETVSGEINRLRCPMNKVGMAPAQTPKPSFSQGFSMIPHWNSHRSRGRRQGTAKGP